MSIYQLDLISVMKRVRKDNPFMSTLELLQAEQQYRNFLELNRLYPEYSFVPTALADKVWHTHLLFSAQYRQDCLELLGRVLEHSPVGDEAEEGDLAIVRQDTARKYEEHFGYWPGRVVHAVASGGCFSG